MLLESSPSAQPSNLLADLPTIDYSRRTIRPIGVYALHGLASDRQHLLALDWVRGYLVQVNQTDDTSVLNKHQLPAFQDASGLAVWEGQVWFAKGAEVFYCNADFEPQRFVELPYPVDGVAVWQSAVYVSSQKLGYIVVFRSQDRPSNHPLPQSRRGHRAADGARRGALGL